MDAVTFGWWVVAGVVAGWAMVVVAAAGEVVDHDRRSPSPLQALPVLTVVGLAPVLVGWFGYTFGIPVAGRDLWRVGVVLHGWSAAVALVLSVQAVALPAASFLRPNGPVRWDPRALLPLALVAVAQVAGWFGDLDGPAAWVASPLLFWAVGRVATGTPRLEAAAALARTLAMAAAFAAVLAASMRWMALEGPLPWRWALALLLAPVVAGRPRVLDVAGPVSLVIPMAAWLGWAQVVPVDEPVPRLPPGPHRTTLGPTLPFVCEPTSFWNLTRARTYHDATCERRWPALDVLAEHPNAFRFEYHGTQQLAVDDGRAYVPIVVGTQLALRSRLDDAVFVFPRSFTRFRADDGDIGLAELKRRASGRPLVFPLVIGWTLQDWLTICAHTGASACYLEGAPSPWSP